MRRSLDGGWRVARRRSFGTIRQLPSGRFQARYPGPDGRLRTAPDTFESRADASRFLSAIETDMLRGLWSDPKTGDTTLRVYADAWLAERRVRGRPLAPRTVDTYRHSLDMWILPFLGEMPLRTITPAVVRRWHAEVSSSTGITATRQACARSSIRPSPTTRSHAIHAASEAPASRTRRSDR